MPPQDPNQTRNPLAVMQKDEQVIFELKRHPIGILIIYVMTGIVLVVLAVAVFGVAPSAVGETSKNQVLTFGGIGFVIFALLCLLFNWVATVVYWGNRWILTDDSITQISQTGLFHKEASSLGLESLEDVTAEQNGVLSKLFGYGVLKAETAGHRSKFVFIYAPNPTEYARKILEAREKEAIERQRYGANEDSPPPQGPPQPQQSPPAAAYTPPSDPTRPDNSDGFHPNY
jgi:uncharacterized membrane protein YdbT with pleckstrin-like domain